MNADTLVIIFSFLKFHDMRKMFYVNKLFMTTLEKNIDMCNKYLKIMQAPHIYIINFIKAKDISEIKWIFKQVNNDFNKVSKGSFDYAKFLLQIAMRTEDPNIIQIIMLMCDPKCLHSALESEFSYNSDIYQNIYKSACDNIKAKSDPKINSMSKWIISNVFDKMQYTKNAEHLSKNGARVVIKYLVQKNMVEEYYEFCKILAESKNINKTEILTNTEYSTISSIDMCDAIINITQKHGNKITFNDLVKQLDHSKLSSIILKLVTRFNKWTVEKWCIDSVCGDGNPQHISNLIKLGCNIEKDHAVILVQSDLVTTYNIYECVISHLYQDKSDLDIIYDMFTKNAYQSAYWIITKKNIDMVFPVGLFKTLCYRGDTYLHFSQYIYKTNKLCINELKNGYKGIVRENESNSTMFGSLLTMIWLDSIGVKINFDEMDTRLITHHSHFTKYNISSDDVVQIYNMLYKHKCSNATKFRIIKWATGLICKIAINSLRISNNDENCLKCIEIAYSFIKIPVKKNDVLCSGYNPSEPLFEDFSLCKWKKYVCKYMLPILTVFVIPQEICVVMTFIELLCDNDPNFKISTKN